MSRKSVTLLDTTFGVVEPVGPKVPAAAYYGNVGALQTIALYNANLTGRLIVEASLAADPNDNDWFPIDLDLTANNYVEYTASSGVFFFNIKGNYVWLRGKIDRSYLTPNVDTNFYGHISKILLNF
jgi:hypothetical protein